MQVNLTPEAQAVLGEIMVPTGQTAESVINGAVQNLMLPEWDEKYAAEVRSKLDEAVRRRDAGAPTVPPEVASASACTRRRENARTGSPRRVTPYASRHAVENLLMPEWDEE
jgi:hypothetical protein